MLLHDTDSDCSLIREQGAGRLRPGRHLLLKLVKRKVNNSNLRMQCIFDWYIYVLSSLLPNLLMQLYNASICNTQAACIFWFTLGYLSQMVTVANIRMNKLYHQLEGDATQFSEFIGFQHQSAKGNSVNFNLNGLHPMIQVAWYLARRFKKDWIFSTELFPNVLFTNEEVCKQRKFNEQKIKKIFLNWKIMLKNNFISSIRLRLLKQNNMKNKLIQKFKIWRTLCHKKNVPFLSAPDIQTRDLRPAFSQSSSIWDRDVPLLFSLKIGLCIIEQEFLFLQLSKKKQPFDCRLKSIFKSIIWPTVSLIWCLAAVLSYASLIYYYCARKRNWRYGQCV